MQRECDNCSKTYHGRADSKYCGGACRVAAHRKKKREKRNEQKLTVNDE